MGGWMAYYLYVYAIDFVPLEPTALQASFDFIHKNIVKYIFVFI